MNASSLNRSAGTSGPDKPVLGLTLGDPAGIGPEIVARAVADEAVRKAARLVVIGSEDFLPAGVRRVSPESPCVFEKGENAVSVATSPPDPIVLGEASREAGFAALAALRFGADLAMNGRIHGLVTAPVCKQALHLAGERVEGQTELLARWDGVEDFEMLATADRMRVMLLSRHLSLRDALDVVTSENVLNHLRLLSRAMVELGFARPNLALAGLNPHAGEGGLIGCEELDVLQPAVVAARAEGLRVSDPLPPDSVFVRAAAGEFDAVLALYHDQAFIPLKLAGAAPGVQPLTTIAGLSYLRVSPAHGTAFDIAGSGAASPDNLIAAILQAASWVCTRADRSSLHDRTDIHSTKDSP